MPAASHLTLQLARFDRLRSPGAVTPGDRPGLRFCQAGADCRAAGTDPASQEAFTFVVVGLHDTEASADGLLADVAAVAPWLDEADERWSAVLAPYRTKGTSNLVAPAAPDRLFNPLVAAPPPGTPMVVLTTAGWNRDGLDMARVQDFGTGTGAVRVSMTAVPGLRSQHSFSFPGVLAWDPFTLSFWRDEASAVAFAHRQPSHRRQMDRHRATRNADRLSFSRLTVLRSAGTWNGVDPVAVEAVDAGREASG
jgi:hypothetical protein